MVLAQSKLTAQGQISVPANVRKRLGLSPGSIIEWEDEGSKIVVRRAAQFSLEDIHKKIFTNEPEPKSLSELKEGVREHIRKKHARN